MLYTIADAAAKLGETYKRVYLAIAKGHVTPLQAGRSRLLTEGNVAELRRHFAERPRRGAA